MSNKERKDIEKTVEILKQLDEKNLLLIDSGAKLLKARQDMDEREVAQESEVV